MSLPSHHAPAMLDIRLDTFGRRKEVTTLGSALATYYAARSRTALRDLIGEFMFVSTADEVRIERKKDTLEGAFVRAAGGQQISVVAGARFVLFLQCRFASNCGRFGRQLKSELAGLVASESNR